MGKYDINTIKSYINGDDIDNYSLEELENDKLFMMKVIMESGDKNIYNLCSNSVKCDYEFVDFLIKRFKNNIDYLCKIANYYIENSNDELSKTELLIRMTDITKGKNIDDYYKYILRLNAIFQLKRIHIEVGKAGLNDEKLSTEIGMGFLLFFDDFHGSEIVLDFYAKRMIYAIFEENDLNLSRIIHSRFNDPKDIDKIGINNYILRFIECYDSMLSSYLSTHVYLIKELSDKIVSIQKNWDIYNKINEEEKYYYMFDKVHEYMEEHDDGVLDETSLLYYIGKKLGIINKIMEYDSFISKLGNCTLYETDNMFVEDALENNIEDRKNYNNLKKLISSIIFENNNIEESKDDNKKCKIIKMNLSGRKKSY